MNKSSNNSRGYGRRGLNIKITPRNLNRACERNTLSKEVKRIEDSWNQLNRMYKSLQNDYQSIRANHTTMAVISRRQQGDIALHEKKIALLQGDKVNLKSKIEDLEKRVKELSDSVVQLKEEQGDCQARGLAKEAVLANIKAKVKNIKTELGPWSKYNISFDELDEIFKELDPLI